MTCSTNNLNITKLAYEKINDKYSKAKYGEFDVIMDMTNGYINVTKLCTDGGKQMKHWLENKNSKELIKYFGEENKNKGSVGLPTDPLYMITTGPNNLRGTYVDSKLACMVAIWISPAFAFKVSNIVNDFLIREKEDEIRKLTGDKCKLEKMFEEADKRALEESKRRDEADKRALEESKRREEADKRREEAEKRAEAMLLKMTLQNEKTHTKLDKTKDILKRVETRVEKIVKEVVPPAKQKSLHETVGLMKTYDKDDKNQYKVYCTQKRGIAIAKNSILKKYPKAVLIKEIKPNANSKNFLHTLKEKYGTVKKSKIKVTYNFINLKTGVTEEELLAMMDDVVENALNFGSDEEE